MKYTVFEEPSTSARIEASMSANKLDLLKKITMDFLEYLNQVDNPALASLIEILTDKTRSVQNNPKLFNEYKISCVEIVRAHLALLSPDQLNRQLSIVEHISEALRYMFSVIDLLLVSVLCIRRTMEDSYTPGAPSLVGRNHFFQPPHTNNELANAIENYQEQLHRLGSELDVEIAEPDSIKNTKG